MGFILLSRINLSENRRARQMREQFIQARKSAGLTQAGLAERLGRPNPSCPNMSAETQVDVIELCEVAMLSGLIPFIPATLLW